MRRAKASFMNWGKWRGVRNIILILSSSALLMCISTLTKFCYQKSIPVSSSSDPPFQHINPPIPPLSHDAAPLEPSQIKSTLDAVIRKIQQEISDMNAPSINPFRYRAFLSEISSHLESIQSSMPIIPEKFSQQSNQLAVPSTNTSATEHHHHRDHDPVLHKKPFEAEDLFLMEEIKKYVKMRPNRLKKQNFMGAEGTLTSIGHGCFNMVSELEQYMEYEVGELCKDDWKLAQKLMVRGCDPLPRRRCLARAPRLYRKPLPIPDSLWKLPDDRNVRWSHYKCKSFACLASNSSSSPRKKGFHKCSQCFDLAQHETPRWISSSSNQQNLSSSPSSPSSSVQDFFIPEVLQIKPGEIRIGLDFSVGVGTFAARMREFNVTVVSAAINIGAPFSETIALRGLVPLYITINQRLPFFDNTMDLIHTTRFLDGWIDLVLLDFVLYDWDRVLRPGGLLWVDGFFCLKQDLEDYLKAFRMLRYKRHKWVIAPKLDKHDQEVFFSAVLEKPPRPF